MEKLVALIRIIVLFVEFITLNHVCWLGYLCYIWLFLEKKRKLNKTKNQKIE